MIDTPITEHGFAGLGVGAAFAGLRPIVEFMTFNFAMQAIDQIINSAAKTLYMSGGQMGCPIVFRGPNGAAARVARPARQCYATLYAHVPGLQACWRRGRAADAKGLLKAAIRDPNPVIFLENEILYGQQLRGAGDRRLRRADRQGQDRARRARTSPSSAFSIMVGKALQAAEELAKEGIEAEVIDLRLPAAVRHRDGRRLGARRPTGWCRSRRAGRSPASASELAAQMMEQAFDWLDAPVKRVHGLDVPLPYAANLEKLALPQRGRTSSRPPAKSAIADAGARPCRSTS